MLKIKKLNKKAILPTKGTSSAAGFDLYACLDEPISIPSDRVAKIGVGCAAEIPEGYFGGLYARSGLSTREGLRLANSVGVVDSDYRGEIIIPLYNDSPIERIVHNGDRIAQMVIQPYLVTEIEEVEDLQNTERGEGGFGSTGK